MCFDVFLVCFFVCLRLFWCDLGVDVFWWILMCFDSFLVRFGWFRLVLMFWLGFGMF